jgi:hypothetical protein
MVWIKKIFFLLIFVPLFSYAQFQDEIASGSTDRFQVFIRNQSTLVETPKINLFLDNSKKDVFDGGDQNNISTSTFNLATILKNGSLLSADKRPYAGRYYVDFPVYMKLPEAGDYAFAIPNQTMLINNAATVIRLIDYSGPDAFANLLTEDYVFTADEGENSTRFVIRVYAACLFNKVTDDNLYDWSDPANWIGAEGEVPGLSGNPKIDNAVIIPADTKVVINTGDLSIGALFNGGELHIKPSVELTVNHGVKLASVEDVW